MRNNTGRKRKKIDFLFLRDVLLINVFLFAAILILAYITFEASFFNPLKKAFSDFSFSNIYFTRMADTTRIDTNVILVNTGNLTRLEQARLISNLSKYHPKVIGIDHLYLVEKPDDSVFIEAIRNAPPIVTACALSDFRDEKYTSLLKSAPHLPFRYIGFANFPVDEPQMSTIRHTLLNYTIDKDTLYSLALSIVRKYDSLRFIKAKRWINENQLINYSGNLSCFINLEGRHYLDSAADLNIIRDKIVLLGYMGDSLNTSPLKLEDIFYTPMNTRIAGHSYPDMYGVVIHANVISMILQDKFIYCVPFFYEGLFAFVFIFLQLLWVVKLAQKQKEHSEVLVVILQYVSSGVLLYLYFMLFAKARISFDMTLTIVGLIAMKLAVEIYSFVIEFLNRYFKIRTTLNH